MENVATLQEEPVNTVIVDGNEIIETSGEEVIISDADECQRKAFELNVEKYKNSLSPLMREKAMIGLA